MIKYVLFALMLTFYTNLFGQNQNVGIELEVPEYDSITYSAPKDLICSPLEKPYSEIKYEVNLPSEMKSIVDGNLGSFSLPLVNNLFPIYRYKLTQISKNTFEIKYKLTFYVMRTDTDDKKVTWNCRSNLY